MNMRMSMRRSPWALAAMSPDANAIAAQLNLQVMGDSPKGPWTVRHPRIIGSLEGADVNALVLAAAKEITGE